MEDLAFPQRPQMIDLAPCSFVLFFFLSGFVMHFMLYFAACCKIHINAGLEGIFSTLSMPVAHQLHTSL